jgi:hypothetical protein
VKVTITAQEINEIKIKAKNTIENEFPHLSYAFEIMWKEVVKEITSLENLNITIEENTCGHSGVEIKPHSVSWDLGTR